MGGIRLAVDAVVFTLKNNELQILLIKRNKEPFKGMYALPGGMVEDNEETEDAVLRELQEETGVKDIYLKKHDVYTKVDRDPRARVVSIAYIALISHEKFKLNPTTDADEAEWFSVYDLPKLAFDHKKIIKESLHHLRFEVQTTNIAFQILPSRFTLSELQKTYELVLDKDLDKRNFRKRIKAFEILLETNETKMEGAHRPARLYKFKDKNYQPLKDKMHVIL
jgi:8-oxo-dGTP diphosphatase